MISIIELSASQVRAVRHEVVVIYRNAFSAPPYNKPEAELEEFADSLPRQTDREGYRFVGAFHEDTGQLVGFAYGYAIAAALWWRQAVTPALPVEVAAHWLESSYQFVELAVDPGVQGRGIGGRLHDCLLRDIPYSRALLSTLQGDTVAHHLYRRRGWVLLRDDFAFPGIDRPYRIMGLEIAARHGAS